MALGGKRHPFEYLLLLADLIILEFTLAIAYCIRYDYATLRRGDGVEIYAAAGMLAAGLWILLYASNRGGYIRAGWSLSKTAGNLLFGYLAAGLCFLAELYLTKVLYSRLVLIDWAVMGFVGLILVRLLVWHTSSTWSRSGRRKVLLVGSVDLVLEAASKIRNHPELRYELVGLFCLERETAGLQLEEQPEPHTLVTALELISQKGVEEIFLLLSELPGAELVSFLTACRDRNIVVRVLPYPYELYVSKVEVSDLEGMPLLEITGHGFPAWAMVAKRVFDLAVGLLLLPLFVPAMAVVGLALLLNGKRPVFCSDIRAGLNGAPFHMFRFNVPWEKEKTPLERALLRYSLTELPQLFNVISGNMSLVGPRPESLDRTKHYSEWHRRRLRVHPGITGLAQVRGLRNSDTTESKIRYDLQYVARWSPYQDAVLLLETSWSLLGRARRATAARLSNAVPENSPSIFAEKAGG